MDADLLIRLRTIAETAGAADMVKAIDGVIGKTEQANAAQGQSAISVEQLRRAQGSLNTTLNATAALLRGDVTGALNQFSAASQSAARSLGKLAIAAGAFIAAYKLGKIIDDTFHLSDAIAKVLVPAEKLDAVTRRNMDAMRALSQADLRNLLDQLNQAVKASEALLDANERTFRRTQRVTTAEQERQIAEAQSREADPERRSAIGTTMRDQFGRQNIQSEIDFQTAQRNQLRTEQEGLYERIERLMAEALTVQTTSTAAATKANAPGASPQDMRLANEERQIADARIKAIDAEIEALSARARDLKDKIAESQAATTVLEKQFQTATMPAPPAATPPPPAVGPSIREQLAQARAQAREYDRMQRQGLPDLETVAARERGQATAAQQALDTFDARPTDAAGRRISPRGSDARRRRADLVATVQRETAEADQADSELDAALTRLASIIQRHNRRIADLEQQSKNLE